MDNLRKNLLQPKMLDQKIIYSRGHEHDVLDILRDAFVRMHPDFAHECDNVRRLKFTSHCTYVSPADNDKSDNCQHDPPYVPDSNQTHNEIRIDGEQHISFNKDITKLSVNEYH